MQPIFQAAASTATAVAPTSRSPGPIGHMVPVMVPLIYPQGTRPAVNPYLRSNRTARPLCETSGHAIIRPSARPTIGPEKLVAGALHLRTLGKKVAEPISV